MSFLRSGHKIPRGAPIRRTILTGRVPRSYPVAKGYEKPGSLYRRYDGTGYRHFIQERRTTTLRDERPGGRVAHPCTDHLGVPTTLPDLNPCLALSLVIPTSPKKDPEGESQTSESRPLCNREDVLRVTQTRVVRGRETEVSTELSDPYHRVGKLGS